MNSTVNCSSNPSRSYEYIEYVNSYRKSFDLEDYLKPVRSFKCGIRSMLGRRLIERSLFSLRAESDTTSHRTTILETTMQVDLTRASQCHFPLSHQQKCQSGLQTISIPTPPVKYKLISIDYQGTLAE